MKVKKILSALLAITMLACSMGTAVFAADTTEDGTTTKVAVRKADNSETQYETLLAALAAQETGDTIVVYSDIVEDLSKDENDERIIVSGNIVSGSSTGVTITNTAEDYVYMESLTIGEGIHFISNGIFFRDGESNIYGTVEVIPPDGIYYQGYDATVNVYAPGKVIVDGSTILRYNTDSKAGLYIYGDTNPETVEFSCSYYIGAYSGTFYAENAEIEAGYFLLKNSYDSEKNAGYAGIDLNLDNSTVETVGTSDGQGQFIADADASINLTNGSSLDIKTTYQADSTVEVSADATSSIAASNYAMISSYEDLSAAVTAGKKVILANDITATGEINGTDANIDLNGNTLTLTVGGTNFFGDYVISNGTIDITGCVASGDCIIGIGDYSNNATLTLNNVNITGDGYSSAYAVLYVYGSSTLNINGGSVIVSNDSAEAGGVIKAHSAANGKINITGTESDPVELTFTDAKIGILDGTVVMDYVDLDITGGANAINQSALTVKNSSLTIKDCDGRALTLSQGDITVENSTLDFSGASEGEIRFKNALTLNVDDSSTINKCNIYADSTATGANVNGEAVTGTETEPQDVTVIEGVTTITEAEKATWTWATDAGAYKDGELTYGMMRFLFNVDYEGTFTKTGIKYFNSELTEVTHNDVAGNKAAFYGDIIGIPADTDATKTYYAKAYVKVGSDENAVWYWSEAVPCTPDFTKVFTNYTPAEVTE